MAEEITFWFVLKMVLAVVAATVVYFVPALVANGKHQQRAIFYLNLLAGWTGLGWLAALYWAIVTPRLAPRPASRPATSTADELTKLARLRDSGALSSAEFEHQKARLLA